MFHTTNILRINDDSTNSRVFTAFFLINCQMIESFKLKQIFAFNELPWQAKRLYEYIHVGAIVTMKNGFVSCVPQRLSTDCGCIETISTI